MRYADLVLVFSSSANSSKKLRAQESASQYTRLINLLNCSGLTAVGKRGNAPADVLILLRCSDAKVAELAKRERQLDFLHGLPVSASEDLQHEPEVTPANRIRLIHSYVTNDLGVVPLSTEWSRVRDMLAVHDSEFDARWVKSLTRGVGATVHIDKLKDHYGEEVAMYFAFLSVYTKSLTFIAPVGAFFYFATTYSPYYSIILLLWATFFVEYWNVYQRKISIRWRTKGVHQVENPRPQYRQSSSTSWWIRETKNTLPMIASIAVLAVFVVLLTGAVTGVFFLEAFLAILYTGPGSQFAFLAPPVAFAVSVLSIVGVYRPVAILFTNWENHKHDSSYQASLSVKRFALSTLMTYLGLVFSCFVYIPFGEDVLGLVHAYIHDDVPHLDSEHTEGIWERDIKKASTRLDNSRLEKQMIGFTVTAQIGNAFTEIGMPFVIRTIVTLVTKRSRPKSKPVGDLTEQAFLQEVRDDVQFRLRYDVFDDYSEMLTQFGYVVIWSCIWPLAPVTALLNNWLEAPSDAFKITTHLRRPIPVRTESIGAWLRCLKALTWFGAIINTIIVYLLGNSRPIQGETLLWALVLASLASHAYLVVQHLMAVVLERLFWNKSREEQEMIQCERWAKDVCWDVIAVSSSDEETHEEELSDFWSLDEGLAEIRRGLKEA